MAITANDVLEVLSDMRLRNIRFVAGPIPVNSIEYDKVADYIQSGAIAVKPAGGNFSLYYPEIDTLKTRDGDPINDLSVRTNLLHECTHIIADLNKVSITRMKDEATAYLAQIAYLMQLAPNTPEPPVNGSPIEKIMRLGMNLVKKYSIGKPAGIGATIDDKDIEALAVTVHAHPAYGKDENGKKIALEEMLKADGVGLSKKEAEEFYRRQLSRLASKMLDDLMAEDVERLLTISSRNVAYENYVTEDSELLELFDIHKRGPENKKKAAIKRLARIFVTINQRSATALVQRLIASKKGDIVSERFNREIPPDLKTELLKALRLSR